MIGATFCRVMERLLILLFVICIHNSVVCIQSSVASYYDCPVDCLCDYTTQNVLCANIGNVSWTSFWTHIPSGVKYLHIKGGDTNSIPRGPSDRSFPSLTSLHIEDCGVDALEPYAFQHFPNLEQLHLPFNNIARLNASYFGGLLNLQLLNISHNELTTIHKDTFQNLTSMETLDISDNDLSFLPIGVLWNLFDIKHVNLSHNHIKYIHPNTFMSLINLEVLNLRNNQLDTLHEATFSNVTLTEAHLSGNPWDCHCGITWLVHEVNMNDAYVDTEEMICETPWNRRQQKVVELDPDSLFCDSPSFDVLPSNETIQYMHSTWLHCNVSSESPSSIYWMTPRGVVVHPDHRRWLPPSINRFSHRLAYQGRPSFWEASVEALANGTLLVQNFRMYFAGEYTCVAENPEGVVSVSVVLGIYSILNGVMAWSTMIGYSTAISCLIAGIIFGAVRMCAEKHCQCCKPDATKSSISADEAVDPLDDTYNYEQYFRERHWTNAGEYQYDYDHTFRSPSLSPRMSPLKCVTPAEYEDGEAPPHLTDDIKELLLMVRASLRHGVDYGTEHMRNATATLRETSAHRVEHMRERAQTIRDNLRETSTNTLQRMRTTSTQYASRARTSVAMGLDQVKSHVQSMKELCGTGEIGQTMSVVSVQTDVDSQETTQVVKAVTML